MNIQHRREISNCYLHRFNQKAEEHNCRRQLVPYLHRFITGDSARILDVGCGPFSTLGTHLDGVSLEIVACDVLADKYRKIAQKKGIVPIIQIEKQDMECMTYDDESFDIVHCRNALDHTNNPIDALGEMLRVCKPGGFVYLRHFENVGKNNDYSGSHHWNICLFDDDCKIWNDYKMFSLSSICSDHSSSHDGRMIETIIGKSK